MSAALRLFFALWPTPAARDALSAHAARLATACGGRTVDAAQLHLTLCFLGAQTPDRLEAIRRAAGTIRGARFTLVADRLQRLDDGLIWLGISHPPAALNALHAALCEALRAAGVGFDRRRFRPHVTLVRRSRTLPARDLTPVRWTAERFALVASQRDAQGARYDTLAEWALEREAA
jgi:2'-5' RNA ligase